MSDTKRPHVITGDEVPAADQPFVVPQKPEDKPEPKKDEIHERRVPRYDN